MLTAETDFASRLSFPRKMKRILFPLVIAMAASLPRLAVADAPARQIDLNRFPATKLDNVVVPLPSEVFNVLDKLGTPDWRGELRNPNINNRGERAQIALLLGSVVAEGFVAVEATDRERVKQVGRDVLQLARAIGVEKTVLARTNSILTKADSDDWVGVRRELSVVHRLQRDPLGGQHARGGRARATVQGTGRLPDRLE